MRVFPQNVENANCVNRHVFIDIEYRSYFYPAASNLGTGPLLRGGGRATKRDGGGASKVLPLHKGGAEKVLR